MVKPNGWPDVEQFYLELLRQGWNMVAVLELVRHIRSTGLADRLFACISLDKLIVGIYDPIEWQRETLHIEFDGATNTWTFAYYSRPHTMPGFVRKYPVEEGLKKFDQFIEVIKW